jgi:tetratricopeptide (TPR) repeat protein
MPDAEQALFPRLAVFAGAFTLEAAEDILSGEGIASDDVLPVLARLVEKSFVEAAPETGRCRLLETVRLYAAAKLSPGELQGLRFRHFDHYFRLVEETEPKLKTGEVLRWLDELESVLPDLRAALAWSLGKAGSIPAQDPWQGLLMASGLERLWSDRCYFQEGRGWIEQGLRQVNVTDQSHARVLGRAFLTAGALASEQFDQRKASEFLEKSSSCFRESGDQQGLATALMLLAKIRYFQRDRAGAFDLIDESIAISSETGDLWELALALSIKGGFYFWRDNQYELARTATQKSIRLFLEAGDRLEAYANYSQLGYIYYRSGDNDQARRYAEKALETYRENKDKAAAAFACEILTQITCAQGDFPAMEAYALESLNLSRGLGHEGLYVDDLAWLAFAVLGSGDVQRSAALFAEHLTLLLGTQNERDIPRDMVGWAQIAISQADAERACRWLGAVEAFQEESDFHPGPAVTKLVEMAKEAARDSLAPSVFAAAWAEGRAMRFEQIVAEAVQVAEEMTWKSYR